VTEQVIEAILAEAEPEDHEVKPADVALKLARVCERAGQPGGRPSRGPSPGSMQGEGRPSWNATAMIVRCGGASASGSL